MRIAIEASTWVNTRGYGRFTRELTRALLTAESPHRFTIVVDSGGARAMPDLPGADVVVVGTTRAVVDAATAESARSIGDLARMAARLSRGFDAVLFPTNYSFVPLFPGTRIAVVVHDAIPETLPALVLGGRRARLLWNLKNRLAFQQADLIATVSEASKREISRRLPVGRKDILVLTEGVADAFSSQATVTDEALVRSAVPRPGRYILFVGGISPHKRVAELVRAFGEIASRSEFEDLQLVLAGPDGRDKFAADQAGVTEAVRALGTSSAR